MANIEIRARRPDDEAWVRKILEERWGAVRIATRGRLVDAAALPGLVAIAGEKPVGLVTYELLGSQCEVISLDSWAEGQGVGAALLSHLVDLVRAAGCRRLWLITTNDNLRALRFYQKRGWHLVAVHRNALAVSRCLKPSIPLLGYDDIPLRDEIELEYPL